MCTIGNQGLALRSNDPRARILKWGFSLPQKEGIPDVSCLPSRHFHKKWGRTTSGAELTPHSADFRPPQIPTNYSDSGITNPPQHRLLETHAKMAVFVNLMDGTTVFILQINIFPLPYMYKGKIDPVGTYRITGRNRVCFPFLVKHFLSPLGHGKVSPHHTHWEMQVRMRVKTP